MSYTVTKYKDVFTLNNTGGASLTYIISKLSDCYNFTEYQAQSTLLAGASVALSLTDGEYQLAITDSGVDSTVTIKYYNNLLISTIEDVSLLLCGCDCDDDSTDDCDAALTTVVKLLTYIALTNPQYDFALQKVSEVVKCLLDIDISCLLINEKITGMSDNANLTKKVVAMYYLAIYFAELMQQSADDEEILYIKTKQKYASISKCIIKLGIDIEEVETIITNNMGTITINSGAYVNLPPSAVGDNTLSVLNRAVTTLTLAMFTTSTTPAYTDPEGDAVDALRVDTLPVDGVLYLDGVAVTAGQIIDVADINANLFTYESPDQDALDTDTFEFSLRDVGSLTFSS
jgi:hypothetical protein